MIIPDVNLLIYAVNASSLNHSQAREWWEDLLYSEHPVGIYSGVASAFVRITTNRRASAKPLDVNTAFVHLNAWLKFPSVAFIEFESYDIAVVQKLLESAGTAGSLVSDALIAAAAIRLKATVHSVDSDFGRFPDLKWHNPLT